MSIAPKRLKEKTLANIYLNMALTFVQSGLLTSGAATTLLHGHNGVKLSAIYFFYPSNRKEDVRHFSNLKSSSQQ